MSATQGPGRLRKTADIASFVLAWGMALHQAWLTQHGHEPNEWIMMFAAAIITPTTLQYILAIRTGSPTSSQQSQASPPSSSSADCGS